MKSRLLAAIGLSALTWASAQAAMAQTPAAPSDPTVGEVVITAEKVETTLQRSSVAIQVVTGQEIQRSGVTRATDLNRLVPGLQIGTGGNAAQIYIRGVGDFAASALSNPAVAVNVDGVYVARPQGVNANFYDLARVEVLKGPQGTLYGRNASGGAINLVTTRPMLGDTNGYILGEVGNYATKRLEGRDQRPARPHPGGARLVPAGRPRRLPLGRHGRRVQAGRAAARAVGAQPRRVAADQRRLCARGRQGPRLCDASAAGRHRQVDLRLQSRGQRRPDVDAAARLPAAAGGHRHLCRQRPVERQRRAELGPGPRDPDGAARLSRPGRQRTQLSGGPAQHLVDPVAPDERGGAAFQHHRPPALGGRALLLPRGAEFGPGHLPGLPERHHRPLRRHGQELRRVRPGDVQRHRPVPPDRRPALHPREQDPGRRPLQQQPYRWPPGTPLPLLLDTFGGKTHFTATNWKAGAEFDVAPTSMLFATASTGFKAGGFNQSVPPMDVYDPEKITAYELGLRNRFLGGRVQLNVEAFKWDYNDGQIAHVIFDPKGNLNLITQNAGSASIKGFDVDAQVRVGEGGRLRGLVEYNDATYKRFTYASGYSIFGSPLFNPASVGCPVGAPYPGAIFGTVLIDVNCDGFQMPRAPKWSGQVSYDHTLSLGDGSEINAAATLQFGSARWLGFEYVQSERAKAYQMLDLDLTYTAANAAWSVGGYVHNVTNEALYSGAGEQGFAPPLVYATISPPRTYGVKLRYNIQ